MQHTPAVSVLVTVHNREPYLAECLDSILASTFDDFELIVVDDASRDRSVAIAKEHERDPRVQVAANPQNLGDYPNRNRAASLARGKYLKYLDADDIIYPHSLEIMVDAMEAHPRAMLGLSFNAADPDQPYPFESSPHEVYVRQFFGDSLLGAGPSASIIRRDAFNDVGGFSGRQFVGDTELWLRMADRYPLVSFQPALIWWRRHPGQQMHLERASPDNFAVRAELELQSLSECVSLDAREKRAGLENHRQRHARSLIRLALRDKEPRAAFQLWRRAGFGIADVARGAARRQVAPPGADGGTVGN